MQETMKNCVWNVAKEDRLCQYCMLTHCEDRVNRKYRRYGLVMGRIKQMDVGDEVRFEIGSYGAVRSAASQLKSRFGIVFATRRSADAVYICRIH